MKRVPRRDPKKAPGLVLSVRFPAEQKGNAGVFCKLSVKQTSKTVQLGVLKIRRPPAQGLAKNSWCKSTDHLKFRLTCFHRCFHPFCSLCWPPLFLPFPGPFFTLLSSSSSAPFCRARGTAQSLERGSFSLHLSTKFRQEIPSQNLCENRSVEVWQEVSLQLTSGRAPNYTEHG